MKSRKQTGQAGRMASVRAECRILLTQDGTETLAPLRAALPKPGRAATSASMSRLRSRDKVEGKDAVYEVITWCLEFIIRRNAPAVLAVRK